MVKTHALSSTRPMLKITRSAISRKPVNQKKKKKKNRLGEYIFTPLYWFWGQNSKYPSLQKFGNFLTSWQSVLNGPANDPAVTYSKIQNRLSRAL